MSDLEQQFKQAYQEVQALTQRPDNDTMLALYSYFKQGAQGDVSGDKPGFFDFVGLAKYEAWEKLQGMSQSDAQKAYVELVERLKQS